MILGPSRAAWVTGRWRHARALLVDTSGLMPQCRAEFPHLFWISADSRDGYPREGW